MEIDGDLRAPRRQWSSGSRGGAPGGVGSLWGQSGERQLSVVSVPALVSAFSNPAAVERRARRGRRREGREGQRKPRRWGGAAAQASSREGGGEHVIELTSLALASRALAR